MNGEDEKTYDNVSSNFTWNYLRTHHLSYELCARARRVHHRRSLFNPGSSSTLRGEYFSLLLLLFKSVNWYNLFRLLFIHLLSFLPFFFVVVGVVVHAIWSDVSKEVGGDHFEIFFVVNDARSLISNSMTFRGSLYSRGENSAHGRAYKILNKIIIIIKKKETRHRRRLNVRSNFVIFGYVFVLCGVVVFGGDDWMFNTFSWDFYSSHLTSPLSGGATVTSSCAVFLFQMCAAFSLSPISSFAFKLLAGGSIVEKSRRWVRQVRGSISFFMIRYIFTFFLRRRRNSIRT